MKRLWIAVTLLVLVSAPAFGQEPRYLLDAEFANPGKEVSVSRPQEGLFPIRLILNATPVATGQPAPPSPKPVNLVMSQFSGERGSFLVEILDGCQSNSQVAKQPMDFPATKVIELCMKIPPLPGDGKYTGSMLLSSEDGKPLVKPFVITGPQAALVAHSISPQFITIPFLSRITRSYGSSSDPQQRLSIVLSERSGNADADGVMIGVTVSKSPGGFDMKRNMSFTINGKDVRDLDSGPPIDPSENRLRTVPARGQRALDVSLFGLEPGEYNAVLGFSSPNSAADDSQKQNLVIQVRDSIWWAIIFLLVAVSISFISTKVLAGLRWRANVQRQIHDLTPLWFSSMGPTLAVVWVRAALHQANRLSAKFWLISPDLIEGQLNEVRTMRKILDQAHQLRDLLTRALDPFLLRRVLIGLDGEVSGLDAGALDDATVTRIQAYFQSFEDWLAKDKILAKFESEVMPAVRSLESEIASGTIPDAAKTMIYDLRLAISAALAKPPESVEGMNDLYRKYAKLRALWDGRSDPVALIGSQDLMEVLRIADDRDWQRLKTANLKIRIPASSDTTGLETYMPLQFSVESTDTVAGSYLFKHKVQYCWTFTLQPTKQTLKELMHFKHRPVAATLTPVSMGPSVAQYFPRRGNIQVTVELRYQGESLFVAAQNVEIFDSSKVGFLKTIELAEVGSWLIAAGAAIVTGLSTYYFKSPAFGSFQDYLTLLIWGAGVDQTKNFVQNLRVSSAAPPAGQAH